MKMRTNYEVHASGSVHVFILTGRGWICLNFLEIKNKYRVDNIEKMVAGFFSTMNVNMFFWDILRVNFWLFWVHLK